jgi:hypothetical protein
MHLLQAFLFTTTCSMGKTVAFCRRIPFSTNDHGEAYFRALIKASY